MARFLLVIAFLAAVVGVVIGFLPVEAEAISGGASFGPISVGEESVDVDCGSVLDPNYGPDDVNEPGDLVARIARRNCDEAIDSRATPVLTAFAVAAASFLLAIVLAFLGMLGAGARFVRRRMRS